MNIFVLDDKITNIAPCMVDKHVVKMPLETSQILCTVHHLYPSSWTPPYRATHIYHPCVKWAATSLKNYIYLCELGEDICIEYTYRYGKEHKCRQVIRQCALKHPDIPIGELTPFAQAMPDYFKGENAIVAYRKYYAIAKKHLHSWTKRDTPEWIGEYLNAQSDTRILSP